MELRLTVTRRARSTVVHVDGRLTTVNLKDLEGLINAVQGQTIVDLSNLLSTDDAGVATLRTLAGKGARLVGASPYIALLLNDQH